MNPLLRTFVAASLCVVALASARAQKPAPDVLVFSNGDQLTGHFMRAVNGKIVFKSDMAGEITIGFDKVKELRSSTNFVALRKSAKGVPVAGVGAVHIEAGSVTVTHADAQPETIATKDLAFLIDQSTYNRSVAHEPGFFHAWTGSVTAGASLVRSTENNTTFTAAVALVRAMPPVPFLPPRNRTTVNVNEAFGKQTSPVIPPTTPPSAPVIVQTSIFHADSERDEYFSPKLYALGDVSFDHNYAQGLQLQQIYGGGFGYTVFKTGVHELDLKADAHFERQEFFSTSPGVTAQPSMNLFGSTFSESYQRNLPRKIVFTESANYIPAWSELHAYSANLAGTLALPVVKRLSASINVSDNYLNDPEPFYKKNTIQFTTGITYTLP